MEHGALPIFVLLPQSLNNDVREQALWALSNIAGDPANLRDLGFAEWRSVSDHDSASES